MYLPQITTLNVVKIMPELTLTYFMARSNLVPKALAFFIAFAVFDIIIYSNSTSLNFLGQGHLATLAKCQLSVIIFKGLLL